MGAPARKGMAVQLPVRALALSGRPCCNACVEDRLINIEELAAMLGGVPEKTLRNKFADGTWPVRPVRIGRTLRWRLSEVRKVVRGEVPVPPSPRKPRT